MKLVIRSVLDVDQHYYAWSKSDLEHWEVSPTVHIIQSGPKNLCAARTMFCLQFTRTEVLPNEETGVDELARLIPDMTLSDSTEPGLDIGRVCRCLEALGAGVEDVSHFFSRQDAVSGISLRFKDFLRSRSVSFVSIVLQWLYMFPCD